MKTPFIRRCSLLGLGLALLFAGALPLAAGDDPAKKADPPKPEEKKKVGYGVPGTDTVPVMPPEWKTVAKERLSPGQLDALLQKEQKADQLKPSPLTTDEQFIRRVTLDVTGKLPSPAEIKAFVADPSAGKRAQLIDKLLASDAFNEHWARYWRDVVAARATDNRVKIHQPEFEDWLAAQIKAKKNWGEIAREIITAKGGLSLPIGGPGNPAGTAEEKMDNINGATFLLLTSRGADAINERAAETSRIFLGIQIQCAQCHDHPSDVWKQKQFHEFAAFFSRTKERPVRSSSGKGPRGIELFAVPRGEHQMTDTKDPSIKTTVQPKFITGAGVKPGLPDDARRAALADFIVSKENYWFSAAFANRVWGQLMGQAFCQPVDNMGPLQEVTYPAVLLRLAAHFQATNYDIRELYRLILNTETYQRQTRIGESADKHLRFAANYPAPLRPDALWESLNSALGELNPAMARLRGKDRKDNPLARRFGFEGLFEQMFAFDPSSPPGAVEGTVPQALVLMNNGAIQNKIRAAPGNVLAAILRDHPKDADAVPALYLKALARKPTPRELKVCLEHLGSARSRAEGYEDLLWSLINSAEFQTKR